ncbi:DUF1641 domain-containing protein [Natribaculum luteum]|uniref:DUF1641 domain-containing protein n=1 Tax=Natribaculum luteum TaxID=1586232 RepID=A0ABD5P0Q8_9EURY|nr:DUF1641 domain-containing protein [Natribaculum luteum]
MTENTITGDDEIDQLLVDAIAENPKEVAALIHRVGLLNQLLDVTELASEALDDRLVVDLAATSATLGEAVDGIATEETVRLADAVGANADDLAAGLERVARLEADGDLETLVGVANAASLLSAAMDDDIVMSVGELGSSLGEIADTTADPDTVSGVTALLDGVGTAAATDAPPERLGPVGLLRALRDPDVQRGLGFLVAVARATGVNMQRQRTDEPTNDEKSQG